jgi:hypothetical protein
MASPTERKSFDAPISSFTDATADKPYGGFIAVASDDSLDRDGERLLKSEWVTPLPDRITVDSDHGMSVATTIGSAHPYFDGNNLMIDAAFSSIERAQEVRTLVKEGHVSTVSVAALVDRSKKDGVPRRELLNVGIVAIPANRNAVILDAKAAVFSQAVATIVKGVNEGNGDAAMIQAIHDAAGHLGAACITPAFVDVDDQDADPTGDEDGVNKGYADALRIRAKALSL